MIPEPSASVVLEKDSTYIPEVWAWFAIGIFVIALRWFVRLRTVSYRGLRPDDYLTLPFTALWTINAVIVQITYYTGGNVDVQAAQVASLSDHDVWVLTYGSIWEFVSWYTYSGTIWVLKLQVLFFYKRLSLDLLKPRTVNAVFVVTVLAYAVLILTISLTCRPYHLNWQISPLPGPECTFRPQNFWTLVVLNVGTDLAILSIPAPLLLRLRISWARKFGACLLLLSGLFMISTALVRAVQTLSGAPSVINVNRWGFRETGVGMIAVNASVLLPLWTRRFWGRHGGGAPQQHMMLRQSPEEEARRRALSPPRRPRRLPPGDKWDALWLWTLSAISASSGHRTADRNDDGGREDPELGGMLVSREEVPDKLAADDARHAPQDGEASSGGPAPDTDKEEEKKKKSLSGRPESTRVGVFLEHEEDAVARPPPTRCPGGN